MRSERDDEKLMVQYLLGNLSEEEQVRIEDRAFADAEYLGALEAAEADLIDAYVRGELSPSERLEFERRFLTSSHRRSKVEFARDLVRVTNESKTAQNALLERRPAAWLSLSNLFRGWNPALQFAGVLAVLISVAGASWLLVENRAIRSRVAALETERRNLETRQEQLRRQLTEEQDRTGKLAADLQKPPSVSAPLVASLVLLPGLSRAETGRAQLALNPSAQLAHIEIVLEPRDDYPRYSSEIRTRSGEEVLIRGNLRRRRSAAGDVVSFDVPTNALDAGEYELTLKGVAGDGRAQDLGYYYFRVQKP
jgi:hypothetical protein